MKRLLLLCLTYIMCVGNHQMAAQDSSESPGIFNSSLIPQHILLEINLKY